MAHITFHYLVSNFSLKNRSALKTFITALFEKERIVLNSISYIFCSDTYLHQLNKSYLNHDTLTDIITFPLSDENAPIVSDIYISIDRIKENAFTIGTTFQHELHRVIFHGALHLCGYSDKSNQQKKKMRVLEDHYLHAYFVSRETI